MEPLWKKQLAEALKQSRRPALVGVGQELRGDDAAGILAIRRLQRAIPAAKAATQRPVQSELSAFSKRKAQPSAPFLFEAGPLPEASAGPLRRFGPDWVIFLDAAEMGEDPGAVRCIDPDQLSGTLLGTHTFPMSGFSDYLKSELGCQVAIVGIQPKRLDFDAPVSEAVVEAIEEITAVVLSGISMPAEVKPRRKTRRPSRLR